MSALPPLRPSPEICGRKNKATLDPIRERRKAWMQEAEAQGYSRKQIAQALGIARVIVTRTLGPRETNPLWSGRPDQAARKLGPWGRDCTWHAFTPEQRREIYAIAEKWGCTPSEAIAEIARDYLEARLHPTNQGD